METATRSWRVLQGTPQRYFASSISVDNDGFVYITGYTKGNLDGQNNSGSRDAFTSKYKSDGSRRWTKFLGTTSSNNSISIASDGSVYVTGTARNDLDGQSSKGPGDAFVIKSNSNGTKQWTRLLGTPKNDNGISVNATADGSVYLAGHTYRDLDGNSNSGQADVLLENTMVME